MNHSLSSRVIRNYPYFFSVFIFILLLSFIPSFHPKLSEIATGFRWRDDLISLYASFRFHAGDRVYNNVVVGKDGWFFYTGDFSTPDYQKINPLNRKKLVRFQRQLDELRKELESKGITLLVVISPNKSTVYSQFMPDEIPIIGQETSLDRFVQYMAQNSNTTIVDLRQVLIEASKHRDVYYHTDTHWNAVGAYYGYLEIMKVLAIDYPKMVPYQWSDFDYVYTGDTTRDLARIMGLDNYKEKDWILTPKFNVQLQSTNLSDGPPHIRLVTNVNQNLPKLLIYGDSFYGTLAQFIEPHFREVTSIPFVLDDKVWSLSWINEKKPDVVIIELVERYLDTSLPMLLDD